MDKTLNLTVYWEPDTEYGDNVPRYQRIERDGKSIYRVCNLTDCPEDAIIARDLVAAEDIIDWIKYGMNLAAEGYNDIIVDYKPEEW